MPASSVEKSVSPISEVAKSVAGTAAKVASALDGISITISERN